MSNFDELIERLERIETQNAWLVAAVRRLLMDQAEAPRDEFEDWLAEEDPDLPAQDIGVAVDDDEEDVSQGARVPGPRQPKACPHNQQVLVGGNVACARCGAVLTSSGMAQGRVSPSGQVIPDPHPPQWATQYSPGASSKNPGTPLVPHDVRNNGS